MRRLIAVAAALTAILLYITTLGALSADEDALTTTLHPGWNLIGWIHEETPAADLFDQLDSLESIHDGSGQSMRRPATDAPASEDAALTLQPGRGYWLRIGSDQPLDWTRPAQPSTLRFQLEPGNQLVAWAGPSDRSIDDVLLGLRDQLSLAWRWIAAEQRYIPWSPDSDIPSPDAPPLNRGDAVRIDLLEPTEWLHPTGDLPRIQFAGGLHHQLPDNFREMVEADLRFVVERFAAKFQFEVPTDRLILRIPTTPEALQRQQENRSAISDAWAFSPRTGGGTSIILMPWYFWSERGCDDHARGVPRSCSVLAHEYFHILQYELAGPARNRTPGWLVEGTAIWSYWPLFDRPPPDFHDHQLASDELDLSAHADPYDYAHDLGEVATAFLVRRAGIESIVDFWRNLDPRISPGLSWKTVFARSFGVAYPVFVSEFYQHRRPLFTIVTGRVITTNTSLLSSLYVNSLVSYPSLRKSNVTPDGRFSIRLWRKPEALSGLADHLLYVGSVKLDYCQADVLPDGTVGWISLPDSPGEPPRYTLLADVETIADFNIQLPASFCRQRLILEVTGSYGLSDDLQASYCPVGEDGCSLMTRDAPRKFVGTVPFAGNYRVRLSSWESFWCVAYATANGLAPNLAPGYRSGITPISVSEEGTATMQIHLDSAEQLCVSDSLEE